MNTKISNKGFTSIIFFISQTLFLGVGITQIINSAKTGSIYSLIIGSILGLITLFFIINYSNYEKDLNLFKKNEKLFGKFGIIINIFLFIIFLFYFIFTLWSLNVYIQSKYLNNTPSFVIILLFLIPVIICTNYGIKTVAKVSLNLFIFTLIVIFFSVINLSTHIDIDNFKPFFNVNIITIIKNAFVFISYFLAPTFMMLTIPKNQIEKPYNLTKYVVIFYILGCINFIILFAFIIGIFGIELSSLYYYPEFSLLKKINYFDFIQHIENILTSQWLYSFFISNVINLNFSKEFLNYFKLNKKIYFYSIIVISVLCAIFIFKNTTIGYNFMRKYFIYIFSIPLFILIILSNIIIKNKKNINQ